MTAHKILKTNKRPLRSLFCFSGASQLSDEKAVFLFLGTCFEPLEPVPGHSGKKVAVFTERASRSRFRFSEL